jgi:thiol-disulfide isomerase/thioredoxin
MKWAAFFLAAIMFGQTPVQPGSSQPNQEQQDLQRAVDEAANSPLDLTRRLEQFLRKYPNATQLKEIERALTKAAIDTHDDRRTALYGERVLVSTPDDMLFLDRVARAELALGGKDRAAKALDYARKFQQTVDKLPSVEGAGSAKLKEDRDRGDARALIYQSRAVGTMGNLAEAARLAAMAFSMYPTEESAREWAGVLAAQGFDEQAIQHYADALMIPDTRAQDADRAIDRARVGELYRKAHGSEKGLGDAILEAYDRTSALLAARQKVLAAMDPNASVTDPLGFTISALDGHKLRLASLKGKVVILDFWATWCGPCRIQHPMYERVKEHFKNRDDVVLLSVDADEDHTLVSPFLDQQKWPKGNVYFDDGLLRLLQVNDIPTTILFDRGGRIASRMNGFLPDRFVEQLTERIDAALAEQP